MLPLLPRRLAYALLSAGLQIVLLAAAGASSALAQAGPAPGEVVVNEIFYDPPGTGERLEFVELYNRSDETFALSGFAFADARRDPVLLGAQDTSRLSPGGYAVLVRDGAAFQDAFPDVPCIEPPRWPALNNGGDAVILYHESTVIDAVPYEPGWGGNDDRASLERIDPGGPSNRAFNFGPSEDPRGATPGRRNSLYDQDTSPPVPVFAEQTAPETLDVSFDEPLAPASVTPARFALDGGQRPVSTELLGEARRVLLVFAEAVTSRRLQVAGVRDLAGNALGEASTEIAVRAAPGDLVLNEIMYAPRADAYDGRPDQPEYVELFNRTGRLVSLGGLYWTDRPDEHGGADTLRFGRPRTAVPPGGFAVVHATPDGGALAEAFPAVDFSAAGIVRVPVTRSALGLLNGGDLVALYRADGAALDAVRYDPDWHHPGLAEPRGVALERVRPGGPSNDPANWTSSVAEAGGTPGRPNAVLLVPAEAPEAAGLTVAPSPFSPDGDGRDDHTAIRYRLSSNAALVRLRIFDAYGREVYADEARLTGRTGEVLWDGFGTGGRRLRIGIYVILFEALDAAGGTVEVFKAPVVLARPLH